MARGDTEDEDETLSNGYVENACGRVFPWEDIIAECSEIPQTPGWVDLASEL